MIGCELASARNARTERRGNCGRMHPSSAWRNVADCGQAAGRWPPGAGATAAPAGGGDTTARLRRAAALQRV